MALMVLFPMTRDGKPMSNVPQTVFELTCLRKHTRAHNALPCSRNARCPHWLVLTRRRSSKEGFGGINRVEESFSKKTYETKSLHTTRGGSPLPVQHPEKEVLDESVCLPPSYGYQHAGNVPSLFYGYP